MQTPGGRVPPHNLEAEQALLGGLLLDNAAIDRVVELVSAEDFYREAHRKIFKAILDLTNRSEPVDLLTLSEGLKSKGEIAEVGGAAYLSELTDRAVSAANTAYYARIIREKATLRALIATASEIATRGYEGREDVDLFLDQAEHAIYQIAERKVRASFTKVGDMIVETFKHIEDLYQRKEMVTGVPTGFVDLDRMTAGLQPSDLIIVAGRPSMGKSSFVLNIAEHVAIEKGTGVAVFSLEMSKEQLVLRMLCSQAKVDLSKVRTGFLSARDFPKLATAAGRIADAPVYIDDTPALSALELRAKARRLKRDQSANLGLVVVDYLQLMRGSTGSDSREQEISEISRSLKALAKELHLPVIALSQLNRQVEQRNPPKPRMADLRECVTGDTPVLLTDGRRKPIRELVGTQPQVVAVTPEGRLTSARSDRVWSVGRRPVFRVKLATGQAIRATAEHRLLGPRGWIHVSDVRPGTVLATAEERSTSSIIHSRPEPFAALTGEIVDRRERALSWEPVMSVEPDGVEEVYDLTVPGPGCWIADGIVSHNSGAIEQDADLIAFIYRDEVYNLGNEGKAEIIVAKQRNGPTGEVMLAFRSEYTRFENLEEDFGGPPAGAGDEFGGSEPF